MMSRTNYDKLTMKKGNSVAIDVIVKVKRIPGGIDVRQ